jgi:hypothetical protein
MERRRKRSEREGMEEVKDEESQRRELKMTPVEIKEEEDDIGS